MSALSRLLLLVPLLVFAAGCDSIQTRSDYDQRIDFSNYRTFSWISEHPMLDAAPSVSPLTEGRIQLAIIDAMKDKGITFVPDAKQADFVVGFTVGSRQKLRVDTTTYPVGYRGPFMWGPGYYQDVDVREYTEGRLSIDIFDAKLHQPVWHGYGTKSISGSDQNNPAPLIQKAVAAILKPFPPGPKS
jgi:Domain of unknown function (DUF4136)